MRQPQAWDEVGSSLSGSPQGMQPHTVQAQLWAQSRERTLCLQPRPAELCYHFSPGTQCRVRGARGLGERLWAAGGARQPGRPQMGQVGRLVPQRDETGSGHRGLLTGPHVGAQGRQRTCGPSEGRVCGRAQGLGGATQGAALCPGLWGAR